MLLFLFWSEVMSFLKDKEIKEASKKNSESQILNENEIFRFETLKRKQRINHFPQLNLLCMKNHLTTLLSNMKKLFGTEFSFYPETWILPNDYCDLEVQFVDEKPKFIFVVKPSVGASGEGIILTR